MKREADTRRLNLTSLDPDADTDKVPPHSPLRRRYCANILLQVIAVASEVGREGRGEGRATGQSYRGGGMREDPFDGGRGRACVLYGLRNIYDRSGSQGVGKGNASEGEECREPVWGTRRPTGGGGESVGE